jgi:lipopolysaccharide biosynthesis protein
MLFRQARRFRVRKTIEAARIERGRVPLATSGRVAVIAHWARTAHASKSVCSLVAELQACGYRVVVSSTCEAPEALVFSDPVLEDDLVVVRRPNVGYDFGSWSVALALMPEIATAERVILANDSMVGPFGRLGPFLELFESTAADSWALTDSRQYCLHLQSYFLGFRDGVLSAWPLRQFWAGVREEPEKLQTILQNEIGLSRLLHEEGYVQTAAFPSHTVVSPGQNPVIVGWKSLLERRFPFLKREILRDPAVAPDGEGAAQFVRQLLGIDVREWVEEPEWMDVSGP